MPHRCVEITTTHQLGHKEHAPWLQTGTIKLHDVPVMEHAEGPDLFQKEIKFLVSGLVCLDRPTDSSSSA